MSLELELGLVDDAAHKAELASRLLQNDVFNDAYRSLIDDIEKRLFLSELGAKEEREQLFHLHRAAQMFVNNIASRINQMVLNEPTE